MTDINVFNPLTVPYQTGSYLIFDNLTDVNNFRNATILVEQPYRASGDHQRDLGDLIYELQLLPGFEPPSRIFLVDLREETHGYIDVPGQRGCAVSWYADNDWSNVGQSQWWIETEERLRMAMLDEQGHTSIFKTTFDPDDNRQQERVLPFSRTYVTVDAAYDEKEAGRLIEKAIQVPVVYSRIPVSDHCAPSQAALTELCALAEIFEPTDWIHFHCHGGDGRTTTFLALWDMLQWQGPLPTLEKFSARQCALFTYCLDPEPSSQLSALDCKPESDPWKVRLAKQRWDALERFRQELST